MTSVSASEPGRNYGLRQPTKTAWTEVEVKYNTQPSSGSLAGISDFLEN